MPITLGILAQSRQAVSAGAFDLLESTVLGSNQASVEFTNLATNYSSLYQHLQVRMTTRMNGGGNENVNLEVNGDTGSNYARHTLEGNGSTVTSSAVSSQTSISTFLFAGGTDSGMTDAYAGAIVDILDPFETTKYKTFRGFSGLAATVRTVRLSSGLWMNTNAITSLKFTRTGGGDILAESRFSLYGIKGA